MKQIVVICYPNDWHWVLSLEYINEQLGRGAHVEVWDFSWLAEKGPKQALKKIIGGTELQRSARIWLRKNNVEIQTFRTNLKAKNLSLKEFDFIKSQHSHLDATKHRKIFNTVVEKIGNLNVELKQYRREILEELLKSNAVLEALGMMKTVEPLTMITVNGRFTKNASVREWSIKNKLPLRLLEFGSSEEKFEVFEESPHSVSEITRKMYTYWDFEPIEIRNQIAKDYLDALVNNKVSKVHWRDKMKERILPPLNTEKKVCVFFSSTESEHAGLGDQVDPNKFQNQVEAFRGIINALPSNEWQIFLRRHPRNPDTNAAQDPEEHLWAEFYETSNVTIIEPESQVDSIELGVRADLVGNYWSTIAIELIARGQHSVITLGDAPWNAMIPNHETRTIAAIEEFLTIRPKRIDIEKLYPWAHYYATFGKEFRLFMFSKSIGKWKLASAN